MDPDRGGISAGVGVPVTEINKWKQVFFWSSLLFLGLPSLALMVFLFFFVQQFLELKEDSSKRSYPTCPITKSSTEYGVSLVIYIIQPVIN